MKCFKYLFIFFTVNIFAAVNFTDPSTVTGTNAPDLSVNTKDAWHPKIVTDATGQYVYALWFRSDNSTNCWTVQTAKSTDRGVTWSNPDSTTGNGVSDLSNRSKNAWNAQIATSVANKYVYAIWQRYDDSTNKYTIQLVKSSDYGVSWVNPTTVTGNATPDLSNNTKNASNPQIATDATGQYVYAIWNREHNTTNNSVIQVVISSDYGVSWTNPTTVTGSATPDLSINTKFSNKPEIATDATGQYVYAIWHIYDSTTLKYGVQCAISSDYGVSWSNPTTVTGNSAANLTDNTNNVMNSQIITEDSGRYVYVIWQIYVTASEKYIVQTVKSSDYGVSWEKPTTVTGNTIPDLSVRTKDAYYPQIATSANGQYVYGIWNRKDNETNKNTIQIAKSSNNGVSWTNPTTVTGNATPDLSNNTQNANYSQIATDATGQYIYAIWDRIDNNTGKYTIQIAVSSDYGVSWTNPTTVTGSQIPDLSVRTKDAYYKHQVVTDSTGTYTYVIWQRYDDGTNKITVQAVNGVRE